MPTDYEVAREDLRAAELALMHQRESVAAMRRDLPPGPVLDYTFGTSAGDVRLADLFADPTQPLVLYHFMFGGDHPAPCPMCAMWADGWSAVDHHLAQNLNFVMVSSAPIDETLSLADKRGWSNLRWVSSADSSFKVDIGGESPDGHLFPFLSVYERDGDQARLSYSGAAHIDGDHWRGVDLLSPVWHFLDLTRQGRGDWMPSLNYP